MNEKKYEVVIACGGMGTRLKEITNNYPKPLYPIRGKSTLERCLEQLSNNNFKNILITIGYKSSLFEKFITDFKNKYKISIELFLESSPLGECGALWLVKDKLLEDFIFINGDLIFSIDFERLNLFHKRLSSNLTLVTHTSDHPEDSDLVSVPNGTLIDQIYLKSSNRDNSNFAYLGNAAIFVIKKTLLEKIKAPNKENLKSVFHYIVKNAFDLNINIYSYNTTEYIKDMGTIKRLKIVESDLKKNQLSIRNYKNKQKALFLDRDNTLIKCKMGQYILDINNIEFIDENIIQISSIAKDFNFVCLVTNQPSISMGKLSIRKLDYINSIIIKYCLSKGLKIDVVAFCPHHPHSGFQNEIQVLKKDCFCRKPNPGLLIEQSFFRNINLKKSLMIGDSENDLNAAKNAGCKFKNVNQL